jgi:Tol biopolymer transport system component
MALATALIATLAAAGALAWRLRPAGPPLPSGLTGTLVYVQVQEGREALLLQRPPGTPARLLTSPGEPVESPALSPDGSRVAFVMGGRIGIVSTASRDVRFVTLGVDWRDSAPAWRPDGAALVVAARRPGERSAELHLLEPGATVTDTRRQPLTDTPHADEEAPVFTPDGSAIVFLRQEALHRLEPGSGRTRRLPGGFRLFRSPTFLGDGRLLAPWTEAKQAGIDAFDPGLRERSLLAAGSAVLDRLAASPDGRWLAASVAYDLSALALRQRGEVRLLDAAGRDRGLLAGDWQHGAFSATWGP